jgi:hypothetical protein
MHLNATHVGIEEVADQSDSIFFAPFHHIEESRILLQSSCFLQPHGVR